MRVFIDSDRGVNLDDCEAVSEKLSEVLDEKDPISDAYFLEVSSPGAERPLKKKADVEKAVGKGYMQQHMNHSTVQNHLKAFWYHLIKMNLLLKQK